MSWNVYRGTSPEVVTRALAELSDNSVGRVEKPFILSPRNYDDGY